MENQVGQISTAVSRLEGRDAARLPSQTEPIWSTIERKFKLSRAKDGKQLRFTGGNPLYFMSLIFILIFFAFFFNF